MKRTRITGLLALVALLAACSGGGSGELLPPDRLPGGGDDDDLVAAEGRWSEVVDWPLIPMHMVLLPDSRVLTFGSTPNPEGGIGTEEITGGLRYDLWNPNPAAGEEAHLTLPNFTATDIFCAAQLVLPQPDAGVLIAGGDTFPRREGEPPEDEDDEPGDDNDDGNADATVLDYAETDQLNSATGMNRGRWYASATTLVNGEIYVQGGRSFSDVSGIDRPEIRGLDGVFRLLDGTDTSDLRYYYPRNFVVGDGRIFGFDTRGFMYGLDAAGGNRVDFGRFDELYRGDDGTAAMFRPGRILVFGGNKVEDSVEPAALLIDARAETPVLSRTGDLSSLRRTTTGTILPNGQVLATGGSTFYNENRGVNLAAEIWDPVTGEWTLGAAGTFPRLYHSAALLLADGRVLIGGGGLPGPVAHLDAEIYEPPYLFAADGRRAIRPRISAPDTLEVGRVFRMSFSSGAGNTSLAARVTLLKTGSTTHSWNMDQRFVELPFTVVNANQIEVRMPSQVGDLTPGYYLLTAINAAGVPSESKIVFLGVAPAADAAQDPTLAAIADRAGAVEVAVSFDVAGGDPNAQPLTFAAAGLPPGVSIAALGTGSARVSGTPSAPGIYDVVITASNGTRTASANFVWTVAPPAP